MSQDPQIEQEHAATLFTRWSETALEERLMFFRALPPREAGDLFFGISTHDQAFLIEFLSTSEKRIWLRALAPDDTADVLQSLPVDMRWSLIDLLDDSARFEVAGLLAYEEDEAGGLMNPRFPRIRPDASVREAISYLRKQAHVNLESLYYCYVLDQSQHLLGVISFRDLIIAKETDTVRSRMQTDVVSVNEKMNQVNVAKLMADHDLVAIPVVDETGRMKGIVTHDDIVDVVQEEATEDIHKIGGSEALDVPYMDTPLLSLIKKRAGWLAVLFVGEMLTASAMAHYEEEIASAVVLALFIPLIISSGGNSGSQASTLVIRALALGEIRRRDWYKIFKRELVSGLILGGILATIGIIRIIAWENMFHSYGVHYMKLALTVSLSLVGVVIWGTLSGSMLPLILSKFKLDPASASAPFVATLVDVSGLVIYFSLAKLILSGTLL
ncbi:MAG: magnesium transporter [Proteobacteria bacterium]|nr:MAG: magnesium transporter [Pseudomonadota bacterium]